jgi:pSer/pThr/pTyr-binding forkhead associated (FHA) protein
MPPKSNSINHHLLIIEDDKGRREFPLKEAVYSIGRDPDSDIRLCSQFVSRRHATLVRRQREDGSYYYRIVDGNLKGKASANGLLINSKKTQAHDLEDEDEVIFGPQVSAKYYVLKRDAIPTGPPDEFDITLISPNMMMGDPTTEIDEWGSLG